MAVSKRLRYEILRRDQHTCRYCGAPAPDVPLRIDHVTPVALGGSDDPGNLVTACEPCNSGKTSTTPDAPLVANVADDAIRWAVAMKQAAAEMEAEEEPKLQYRQAFLDAWNEWTYESGGKRETFDLPDDWRSGIERYRLAGIPAVTWPDLIEPGMVNQLVKGRDVFRYTCGVANNRLKQLAERARQIVGASGEQDVADGRKAVLEAAFTVWHSGMSDGDEPPSAQLADEFRQSLAELSDWDLTEPGRIVEAAQHATWFGISSIAEALRDLDRARIWSAWISAWPRTYVPGETDEPWGGRYVGGPSDEAMERVKGKIDKILDAQVPAFRAVQAATHAGFHKSARIYLGLTDEELEAIGEDPWRARSAELWRVAFTAVGEREPSPEETAQFFACLKRIAEDGGFFVGDVYDAAAAAGSWQLPGPGPVHLSTPASLRLRGSCIPAAHRLTPSIPAQREECP